MSNPLLCDLGSLNRNSHSPETFSSTEMINECLTVQDEPLQTFLHALWSVAAINVQ
jgi:hypothetical protein